MLENQNQTAAARVARRHPKTKGLPARVIIEIGKTLDYTRKS